jgi:hypothetical protein
MKTIISGIIGIIIHLTGIAQSGVGAISGVVSDSLNGETIPYAIVKIQSGTNTLGAVANENGEFLIKPIPPGTYTVSFSRTGYSQTDIKNVKVSSGDVTKLNCLLGIPTGKIVEIFYNPTIDELWGRHGGSTVDVITSEDILLNAGDRGPFGVMVNSTPGVYQNESNGEINIRGSRSGASLFIIDGVKIIGDPQIPNAGIEEVVVITGGLPAQYGDTTSGVVIINTKSY